MEHHPLVKGHHHPLVKGHHHPVKEHLPLVKEHHHLMGALQAVMAWMMETTRAVKVAMCMLHVPMESFMTISPVQMV